MITLEDCNEFLDLDVLLGVHKDKKVAVKVSKRHGSGMLDSLLDEARFMMLAIQLLYGCWWKCVDVGDRKHSALVLQEQNRFLQSFNKKTNNSLRF